MPYDRQLAERLRATLADEPDITEKAMFGGLGFMASGSMAVAASSQGALMVRIDPAAGEDLIDGDHVQPMVMRGRAMAGWLLVDLAALDSDDALRTWVGRGVAYARSLAG